MPPRRCEPARLAVPREARDCATEWTRLVAPGPPTGVFEPGRLSELPEAAARWLGTAVPPGTPLTRAAVLHMRGDIKVGRWRPFTAAQVVSPPTGFIWAATTRLAALPFSGFDRYSSGAGQMRWRLLAAIPAMSTTGPDVDRSAAGRLAAESVFVPTAYNHATWAPGPDADTAVATWHIDDHVESVRLRVAADGALRGLSMSRWGNPGGGPYGRHPFGVVVDDEATFDGIRLPAAVRAFWEWGTDRQSEGEFFRAHIDSVTAL